VADLRGILACITRLEDVSPNDSWAVIAKAACTELVNEINERRASDASRTWRDGTKPNRPDLPSWPQLFAARLAPPHIGIRDEERLARHRVDHGWPWSQAELARKRELLDQLLAWSSDVGEHGDNPDPGLYTPVTRAADILRHWIWVATFQNETTESIGKPTSAAWGPFKISCDHDEWYRRTIRWQRGSEETPVHRKLRVLFFSECTNHL